MSAPGVSGPAHKLPGDGGPAPNLDDELQAIRLGAQRVVHDVNNALAPVLGFTELLLEDEELLGDPEKVKRYLGLMRDGANEAVSLVASLRAFYSTKPE